MKALLASILLLMSSLCVPAQAETPDEVRQNYPLVMQGGCQDNETKQNGMCYLFAVGDGTYYMVFVQQGKPVFVRKTHDGGYTEVWRAQLGEPV